MLKLHTHFRGKEEWRILGLYFTTENDESLRIYDSVLTQYVGWYEEDEGLTTTLECLSKSDPNFFIGLAMPLFLELIGTGNSIRRDSKFKTRVNEALIVGKQNCLNPREIRYVKSLELLSNGLMYEACNIWEEILIEHPLDLLALKLAHDCYFYLGLQPQMRDSVARVIVYWQPDLPHYGFLLGMWAFGLCETGDYKKAEEKARAALQINKSDSWATHALAHVLEMQGRYNEGIQFMSETIEDWKQCSMLACHNFWHFAVYYIENNNIEDALNIIDQEIIKRSITSNEMLDIVDVCSILQRLEMIGVNIGERWSQICPVVSQHRYDHVTVFNDVHVIMCLLGNESSIMINEMMSSLHQYIGDDTLCKQSNHKICKVVGMTLFKALVNYKEDHFSEAVELLKSIRYQIITIGGSNAQRDVFSQLMICAAIKSPDHAKFARSLIIERKQLKNNSPLTDKLMDRLSLSFKSVSNEYSISIYKT